MFTLPTLIFWGLLNIFLAFFEKKDRNTIWVSTLWIQIKTIRIQISVQTVNSLLSVDDKTHPSKQSVTLTILYFFISLYSLFNWLLILFMLLKFINKYERWLKEALGLVLEEECFGTTIFFQKKKKKKRSLFMLQIIIFNNWSTERNLKLF